MNSDFWLKVFPEYHIYREGKKYGFRGKEIAYSAGDYEKENYLNNGADIVYAQVDSRYDEYINQQEENLAVYQYEDNVSYEKSKIDDLFAEIENDVQEGFLGQKEYIKQLLLGFKRPYIAGYDKLSARNIMLISGANSTGRHFSIQLLVAGMEKRGLLNNRHYTTVDLALYKTSSDQNIFYTDIYKAFYNREDIVVFDNVEQCYSSFLQIIRQLCITGKYILPRRYSFQRNSLVEVTGSLTEKAVGEIGTNGKYILFITEKKLDDIYEFFDSQWMESIKDMVLLPQYSEYEIENILGVLFKKNLAEYGKRLDVEFDLKNFEDIMQYVLKPMYNFQIGFSGMKKLQIEKVFNPILEYRLEKAFSQGKLYLYWDDNKLLLLDGIITVDLKRYQKNQINDDVEKIKKSIHEIIGLREVKDYLEALDNNLHVQKMRKVAGHMVTPINMHMLFTGNPGTGKTTVARLVAKYLKAVGILSTGQLREVSRADLVGKYVGHTAILTNQVIESALGGVLFIDEAYGLYHGKGDTFGLEAIDAIVKSMEDHRDNLVIIMAGYKKEMQLFIEANSGLKSRFGQTIEFSDYTAEEMYEIACNIASENAYKIAPECKKMLMELFDKAQIKGKNDNGNGRFARNIVEKAILVQSKRILQNDMIDDVLHLSDFSLQEDSVFDLEEHIGKIIGLNEVKDFLRDQDRLLVANKKRQLAGMTTDTSQSLHMVFTGNPGTGKTMVARIMALMLKNLGILKSGQLIEVDRSDLVAEYIGQTAIKTEKVFKSALGGVLFIDEAYTLAKGSEQDFGKEAIETLVKLMEDYKNEIVVILAGYTDKMQQFFAVNKGLASRFPFKIHFKDYDVEELYQIALQFFQEKGFVLESESKKALSQQIEKIARNIDSINGNGRMIRNYVEDIIRHQSLRISAENVVKEEMVKIELADILLPEGGELKQEQVKFDLEGELSQFIGQEEVKNFVRGIYARIKIQNERRILNLPVAEEQTLHMLFKGNPGTGKTTLARIMANILYHLGAIKTNKLIETDRSGLVAEYVGQTALKTKAKLQEAVDGILFIDEAYSLTPTSEHDFGKEAIDTIVKCMDDYRNQLVIILAGYEEELERFIDSNPGLKSRFPNCIIFSDYTTDKLMEMILKMYEKNGYIVADEAKSTLWGVFEKAKRNKSFGNGRYVRNLFEKSLTEQSIRLTKNADVNREMLIMIEKTDIVEV